MDFQDHNIDWFPCSPVPKSSVKGLLSYFFHTDTLIQMFIVFQRRFGILLETGHFRNPAGLAFDWMC